MTNNGLNLPHHQNRSPRIPSPCRPSQARAVQIGFQNFHVPPHFPLLRLSTDLNSLILTSDIKLEEYRDLLTQPFSVPDLPKSINSLPVGSVLGIRRDF